MLIRLGDLRKIFIETVSVVRLYRGMLQSDFVHLDQAGFSVTRHPGNVASSDVSTAIHWAGQRGTEDDPAVVIAFDAPDDAVQEDPWFKSDYRFVKAFMPTNIELVQDGITEPIRG